MAENAERRGILLNIWFTYFSYNTILVLDLTIYSVSFSKYHNMDISAGRWERGHKWFWGSGVLSYESGIKVHHSVAFIEKSLH